MPSRTSRSRPSRTRVSPKDFASPVTRRPFTAQRRSSAAHGTGTGARSPSRLAARESSQVAGTDSRIRSRAYGAAAPYSTGEARDQNSVASVEVPIGASSSVAVSSVLTASETRAMAGAEARAAPAAGSPGARPRAAVQPSDRATSSSTGGASSRVAAHADDGPGQEQDRVAEHQQRQGLVERRDRVDRDGDQRQGDHDAGQRVGRVDAALDDGRRARRGTARPARRPGAPPGSRPLRRRRPGPAWCTVARRQVAGREGRRGAAHQPAGQARERHAEGEHGERRRGRRRTTGRRTDPGAAASRSGARPTRPGTRDADRGPAARGPAAAGRTRPAPAPAGWPPGPLKLVAYWSRIPVVSVG